MCFICNHKSGFETDIEKILRLNQNPDLEVSGKNKSLQSIDLITDWADDIKTEFTGLETIYYYIHDSYGDTFEHLGFQSIEISEPHETGWENYIENIFQSIDGHIAIDFERTYSKPQGNIDIYYIGPLEVGDILGSTDFGTLYDSNIDVFWEQTFQYSEIYGNYGSLKDNDAHTLIHEIGHTLGLDHPQKDGEDDPWGEWHDANDSVMSYRYFGDENLSYTEAPSWRTADIEALQSIWGVETGNAPTSIILSSQYFNENIQANTSIATISTTDADVNDTFIYTFASGDGDTDNSYFTIDGNELKINFSPDDDTKSSYNIRLETIDSGGLSYQEAITLSVLDEFVANIIGTTSIDSLKGTTADDSIDGGAGDDTVVFSGIFSDYSFTRKTNSLQIADQRTAGTTDGTDTLTNIEYIQFSDQTVDESKVDVTKSFSGNFRDYKFYNKGDGNYEIKNSSTGTNDDITGYPSLQFKGEATTSSFKDISAIADIKGTFDQVTGLKTDSGEMFRLYNAAFARFPDADGLKYWIDEFSSGRNTRRTVAKSFLGSDEFAERYGANVSNAKYVETLYVNVLGRDYDQEGYNYWLGNLNSGLETRYEMLLGFAENAENLALFTEMTGLS